ncbi:fimbria/pilus outer membrane usher protein [Escherichia coli]
MRKRLTAARGFFTVPYWSVPAFDIEGHTRYSITAGNTVVEMRSRKTRFFQSTYFHGLPAGWTISGGTQLAVVIVLLISVSGKRGSTGRSVCGYGAG